MGLMSFFKEAGEKLFGKGDAKAAQEAAAKAPSPENIAALNATAAKAIEGYLATQSLAVDDLKVDFDGASTTVTVSGVASSNPGSLPTCSMPASSRRTKCMSRRGAE